MLGYTIQVPSLPIQMNVCVVRNAGKLQNAFAKLVIACVTENTAFFARKLTADLLELCLAPKNVTIRKIELLTTRPAFADSVSPYIVSKIENNSQNCHRQHHIR